MKKLFLISAMVLSFGMMSTVFAATLNTSSKTGTMDVTYGVESGYIVTIPGDVTLTDASAKTAEVSASNVMLEFGSVLIVTISSENYDGNWNLVANDAAANKLPYMVAVNGGPVTNWGEVLRVYSGSDLEEATLSFQLAELPKMAGQYTDVLTFYVDVMN